ncbi:MAG: DUF3592 domain-containing protein [Steroidobacteraceae bacterium]
MFDLLFNSIAAFQQAGLLLLSLVCCGLGALLVAHDLYWRLRATRVEGTVIGVRENKQNTYRAVYRYVLPSGQMAEATSNKGSRLIRGKETGRIVALRVFPERPDEVQEAGSVFVALFGAALIALGAWPMHAALTAFPPTIATGVVFTGFVFYGASRIRTKIIPRNQRFPTLAAWKAYRREQGRHELDATRVRPIEEILNEPARIEQVVRSQRAFRRWSPLLCLLGLALLAGAYHLGHTLHVLKSTGVRTAGGVVALEASTDSDSTTYRPIVEFNTAGNVVVRFKDRVGSNPPSHRTGDAVAVLYAADAPQATAMIDRGVWNWVIPGLLLCFGPSLSALGLNGMTRPKTHLP